MAMVKMALLAGITGTLTSISVFAIPLDITVAGGTVSHDWGENFTMNPAINETALQYADLADFNQPSTINLGGVNSINVTWNAPAGYMYVVNPPPADIGTLFLYLGVSYGVGGQSSSLGSITGSSTSVNTVYGNPSFAGLEFLGLSDDPDVPGIVVEANTEEAPGSAPFAFTGVTVSTDFSKTGRSKTLEANANDPPLYNYVGLFGVLVLYSSPYKGPPDPGQLLTLQPLPTGTTPDDCSTLSLAGLGFAGLVLFRRKL